MSISVEIPDRLYDYTDEEKAAEAIMQFQSSLNLEDKEIIAIWDNASDPRREQLEASIIAAIDANGSVRRAEESIPSEILLVIEQ